MKKLSCLKLKKKNHKKSKNKKTLSRRAKINNKIKIVL
jgi:hypothetical protein